MLPSSDRPGFTMRLASAGCGRPRRSLSLVARPLREFASHFGFSEMSAEDAGVYVRLLAMVGIVAVFLPPSLSSHGRTTRPVRGGKARAFHAPNPKRKNHVGIWTLQLAVYTQRQEQRRVRA